jgi:hypothetical protein
MTEWQEYSQGARKDPVPGSCELCLIAYTACQCLSPGSQSWILDPTEPCWATYH